tara:strand:+ start:2186 stop:2392 length:207 start_codon:yes stop_codon:yes gene_type:complete
MNKILISIAAIFLIYGSGTLIANFFGVSMIYVLPFIGWFIALILFYLILDDVPKNRFMEELKKIKEEY